MNSDERDTLIAPPLELSQHFKDRIQCGRCGNRNSAKFKYMLPLNGSVIVICECGLSFFKEMEANLG
jgi:transcription elongation factor Elf1